MALSNISSSASALQPRGDLFGLLAGMDQVYAESYLRVSEKADSRRPSPFSGLLLALNYDPVAVQNLVDEIWPFRWQRRSGPGRKPEDPLPLVCYILPYCDPEYGTVFNVLDAYRHLEEDKEYRNLCGYSYRVPSRSVFNNVVVAMVDSWSSFQACLLSPEDLEKVKARLLAGAVEELNGPAGGDETPALRAVLDHLGWDGGCPPDYRDEGRFSKVLRTVGLPRGRSCSSGGEIGPPVAEVSSAAGVGAASPSKGPRARDWAAYNDAQTHEALDVKAMIGGFCDQINFLEAQCQPEGYNRRREFPLGHSVFGVLQKAYSRRASRPHEGLLFESVEQGYLRNMPTLRSLGSTGTVVVAASEFVRIPSYNAVTSYLRSLWLTPLLLELVTVTALPLRGLERVFAVDGSGMSSRWYDRWLDHRLGIESDRQQWVKLHLVVGCETGVAVRAAISPGSHHDYPYFSPLVEEISKHFEIETVVADMGYSGRSNHELGGRLGVDIRIPFKDNTSPPSDDGSEWSKNLRYFLEETESFYEEYHPRSVVESAFSTEKRVFPEKLMTKSFPGRTNEALARMVVYNLRVVGQQVRMNGMSLDLLGGVNILENCVRQVVAMRRDSSLAQAA